MKAEVLIFMNIARFVEPLAHAGDLDSIRTAMERVEFARSSQEHMCFLQHPKILKVGRLIGLCKKLLVCGSTIVRGRGRIWGI